MAVDTRQMLEMSQEELDELFRTSPPGEIPRGGTTGTAIVAPDTEFAEVAARLVRLIAWSGKVFNPETGDLTNKIGPFGWRKIRAKVFKGASWFDGNECIVLDYSKTSKVAQWIRDEMREVRPGLYLGIVYWEKQRVLNFALEVPVA